MYNGTNVPQCTFELRNFGKRLDNENTSTVVYSFTQDCIGRQTDSLTMFDLSADKFVHEL